MSKIENSYKNILENLHDGLYFVDKNRVITYWNKAAEKISGYSADEVVGKSCADSILTHVTCLGEHLCSGDCPLMKTMRDNISREDRIYLHHKDGHRLLVSVSTSPLFDDDGEVIGGIELFSNLTQNDVNEARIKELETLAFLDPLTKLANRNYINREMESRFEESKRFGIPFGVLLFDIDFFKKVNDTYGHDIGDKVLQFVATTLSANSRPFDLFGRWGGEEFIGLIRNIDQKNLETLGDRFRILIENSYIIVDKKKISITISIGATIVKTGDNSESIFKRADNLLYKSKESGRNCLTIG